GGRDAGLPRLLGLLASALFILAGDAPAAAAGPPLGTAIEAAAPELDESGVPSFSVYSLDSIGLTSAPTDLRELPDGRLVIAAGHRIAFGDGSAWQVFSPATGHDGTALQLDLVVGPDGGLYNGTLGGVQKIELQPDGHWTVRTIATVAEGDSNRYLPFLRAFRHGEDWLWMSSEGALFAWRPGAPLRMLPNTTHIEYAAEFDGRLLLHQTTKGIIEYKDGAVVRPPALEALNRPEMTVRALIPTGPNQMLIATQVNGLLHFDGHAVRRFELDGGATELRQVNDLCRINERLFAAAAGPDGVVFFDIDGRVVQVLGKSLDHRLGAVRRLRYVDGILWALLHDGLARIEFPSQFSDFTPLAPTTLTYARPYRHEGRLWLLTDGVVLRAVYSPAGHVQRLVADGPEGVFVWSMATIEGVLLACSDSHVFQHTGSGWTPVLADAPNARVEARAPDGRWLYTARGEIGWMTIRDGRPSFERRREPRLGDVYNSVQDTDGVAWLELGVGQLGRIDARQASPSLELFGPDAGLPNSWVQICLFDGEAVFSVADNNYRLDPATRKIVPHPVVTRRFAELHQALGRFGRDAFGRIWVTAHERLIVDSTDARPDSPPPPRIPEALQSAARGFIMETGGVVWIQAPQRLLRYDPRLAHHPLRRVQPVITHVHLPSRGTLLFSPSQDLWLDYEDNNLEFHFAAPRNPFQQQVSYEVRVDGLNGAWIPIESSALAAYNHLREGTYRFRVRAVVNGRPEGETSLAFTIAPPFYRTTAAYLAYAAGALGLLAGVAGLVTWINRRERTRLAALVERRTAELQLSQEQLRRAVESASVGIWDYDFATGRMTWNEQCRRIYGTPPGAHPISRETYEKFIYPDDLEAVRRAVNIAVEQRSELRLEHRIVHPSGDVRWITVIGRSVHDERGRPVSLRGAALDTTERRLADEELRNREHLQRQMIESSPVAMLMVDTRERVLYGNATFTRLFGYTRADIPDVRAWWPLAYPDPEYRELIRAEWTTRMERAAEAHGAVEPMEAVVTCRDGSRRTIQFATSEVGDRTLIVFTDLTERKLAEQAIRDMNATLERRVKERTAELEAANKELESFSYSVSHDLRAPLRGIDGWSLALLEDCGDRLDETARGYLQRVRAETQRLGQLIDDLLKLSRTTRAEFHPVPLNLSELVAHTAQRVATTRHDTRVRFTCQPGLSAHGDPGLLEAALFNLLDNAWKFTAKVPSPEVEFGLTETLSGPAYYVRDNGAGFDMRHARKLFGVFQRMHSQEEFPGTGVGLATVNRIITRHGGRIWADSVPGEQTTFYFQLPGIAHVRD
ncbi:MAG: PAS domain S-box protein, partial [Opitutaceae bacterium]|nr:PAS domain S-box protein [Opitutaceae bacterium]